jgi:hypothetical protein
MHCCVPLAHCCCCCCAVYTDALTMDPPAAYSHRSDKVSVAVPLAPTDCNGSAWTPLSLAAVLAPCSACSRLFIRPVCSSCALSATHGRLCNTNTAPSAATATTSNIATLPMQLQQPLPLPRPLRLSPCTADRVAASTNSPPSSERRLSLCTTCTGHTKTLRRSCIAARTRYLCG